MYEIIITGAYGFREYFKVDEETSISIHMQWTDALAEGVDFTYGKKDLHFRKANIFCLSVEKLPESAIESLLRYANEQQQNLIHFSNDYTANPVACGYKNAKEISTNWNQVTCPVCLGFHEREIYG